MRGLHPCPHDTVTWSPSEVARDNMLNHVTKLHKVRPVADRGSTQYNINPAFFQYMITADEETLCHLFGPRKSLTHPSIAFVG